MSNSILQPSLTLKINLSGVNYLTCQKIVEFDLHKRNVCHSFRSLNFVDCSLFLGVGFEATVALLVCCFFRF